MFTFSGFFLLFFRSVNFSVSLFGNIIISFFLYFCLKYTACVLHTSYFSFKSFLSVCGFFCFCVRLTYFYLSFKLYQYSFSVKTSLFFNYYLLLFPFELFFFYLSVFSSHSAIHYTVPPGEVRFSSIDQISNQVHWRNK